MRSLLAVVIATCFIGDTDPTFSGLQSYQTNEARQAVAADENYFYAIDNAQIGKYELSTGERVALWQAPEESHTKHLNSGIVYNDTLWAAHSNYPDIPRHSSIELWDTHSIQYLGNIDLGETDGAANWILKHHGYWWILYAHYSGKRAEPGRTSADTRLDMLDAKMNVLKSFYLPQSLVQKLEPKSLSGGCFSEDGTLYVTGHDEPEVYALEIPEEGDTLLFKSTLPVNCEGQGIAWHNNKLYTIKRSTKEVIVSELQ